MQRAMAANPTASDHPVPPGDKARVCPSCGLSPGAGIHCERCGANLLWCQRLPTRRQWHTGATEGQSNPPSQRGSLRYLPYELRALYKGPGETARHGWLALALTLNENLEQDERVISVFNSTLFIFSSWWLVVTSKRLACMPVGAVIFRYQQEENFLLDEISYLRSRSRITGSSISLSDPARPIRFSLKGTDTAALLVNDLLKAKESARPAS